MDAPLVGETRQLYELVMKPMVKRMKRMLARVSLAWTGTAATLKLSPRFIREVSLHSGSWNVLFSRPILNGRVSLPFNPHPCVTCKYA